MAYEFIATGLKPAQPVKSMLDSYMQGKEFKQNQEINKVNIESAKTRNEAASLQLEDARNQVAAEKLAGQLPRNEDGSLNIKTPEFREFMKLHPKQGDIYRNAAFKEDIDKFNALKSKLDVVGILSKNAHTPEQKKELKSYFEQWGLGDVDLDLFGDISPYVDELSQKIDRQMRDAETFVANGNHKAAELVMAATNAESRAASAELRYRESQIKLNNAREAAARAGGNDGFKTYNALVNGKPVMVAETGGGVYQIGDNGRPDFTLPVPKGSSRVGLNVTSTDVSGITKGEKVDLRAAEVGARRVMDLTRRIKTQLDENPKTGVVGTFAQLGDTINAQAGQVANMFGKEEDFGDLINPSNYDMSAIFPNTEWAKEANKSAAVQSNFMSLAYMIAKFDDPSGRVAKDDVVAALKQIAGKSGSPGQMRSAIGELERRIGTGLSIYYKVYGDGQNAPNLSGDPTEKVTLTPPKGSGLDQSGSGWDKLSDEDKQYIIDNWKGGK